MLCTHLTQDRMSHDYQDKCVDQSRTYKTYCPVAQILVLKLHRQFHCFNKVAKNLHFVTDSIWAYVVGSKSFRPDQLFKVTEIKQICYFST